MHSGISDIFCRSFNSKMPKIRTVKQPCTYPRKTAEILAADLQFDECLAHTKPSNICKHHHSWDVYNLQTPNLAALSTGHPRIRHAAGRSRKVCADVVQHLQAVIDKVRQRVSPEDFSHFKHQSGSFMRGDASAKDFHTQVVALGLAALLPDLAALCPDPLKRSDLLAVHRSTFVAESAAKVMHASCCMCTTLCIPCMTFCESRHCQSASVHMCKALICSTRIDSCQLADMDHRTTTCCPQVVVLFSTLYYVM